MEDYFASSRRHLDDANSLRNSNRWENADHLAGLSAECSLKHLLLRAFGARPGEGALRLHADKLWPAARLHVKGRQGGRLLRLLVNNPFGDWSVEQRYMTDGHVGPAQVVRHLQAADQMHKLLGTYLRTGQL